MKRNSLWKRRANFFLATSSRESGVPHRRTRKALSPQTDYESRIYFYDRPDPSALVFLHRGGGGTGEDEELIPAPTWFDGGASNHDTVKYIAALFIESNASENNHRRASNNRGGEGDESLDYPFLQASQTRPARPMHDAGIGLMRVFACIVNRGWLPRKLRYRRYVRRARPFFLPPSALLSLPLFARVMSFPPLHRHR